MNNTQNPYLGDPNKINIRGKIRELLTKRKDPNYVKAYLYEVEGLDMDTINTEVDSILTLSGQQPTTQQKKAEGIEVNGQTFTPSTYAEASKYQEDQRAIKAQADSAKAQADSALSSLTEKLGFAEDILQDTQGLKSTAGAVQFQMPWSKTKQRFIGNVEGLLDVESIDALIEAKKQGATFGSLTDRELQMLRSTASKIGKWAVTDPETEKVIGYDIDEETLQKELTRLRDGFQSAKEKIEASRVQETPEATQTTQEPEDDYSYAQTWLQQNPNDPRAEKVKQYLENNRPVQTQEMTQDIPEEATQEKKTLMGEIGETLKDRFSNIFNIVQGKRVKTGEDINTLPQERIFQTIGQLATIPFEVIGDVFEVSYDKLPQEDKAKIEQGLKTLAETEAGKKGLEALGQGVEAYNEWATKNPRLAQNVEGVVNVVSSLTGTKAGQLLTKPIVGMAEKTVKGTTEAVGDLAKGAVEVGGKALSRTGETIGEVAPGATRMAQEFGSRIPRFFKHRAEDLEDANVRAKFIEDAPLAKQNDLKESFNVNLDRNLMITATESDDITKEELRRIVQMAEDPKTPNPNLVGGQAAEKQYDFIISKQKEVGKKIGELEKSLPDMRVNMKPSMENLAKTLLENEISIEKGKIIAPNLTNSQKSAVKELLTLIKQRGESLTPTQIHKADQLFSNLQREKRMDKVSEIYIDVNGERKNLFSTIRELYTGELDKISSFRDLNKEYRKYATLQDDLEKTIFSGGKAAVTKGMDPQEFAKTNLRRAFGEAQSSATYKELADILDKEARDLGYEGASPLVLIDFAERLRKLYPETIPTTGFQGGIQTGVGAAIEATLKAGGPKSTDQVKALKRLLDMEDLKGKGEILPTTQAKQAKDPFIEEAKKYKSAEEFVKAKEENVFKQIDSQFKSKVLKPELKNEEKISLYSWQGSIKRDFPEFYNFDFYQYADTTSELNTKHIFSKMKEAILEKESEYDLLKNKKTQKAVSLYDEITKQKKSIQSLIGKEKELQMKLDYISNSELEEGIKKRKSILEDEYSETLKKQKIEHINKLHEKYPTIKDELKSEGKYDAFFQRNMDEKSAYSKIETKSKKSASSLIGYSEKEKEVYRRIYEAWEANNLTEKGYREKPAFTERMYEIKNKKIQSALETLSSIKTDKIRAFDDYNKGIFYFEIEGKQVSFHAPWKKEFKEKFSALRKVDEYQWVGIRSEVNPLDMSMYDYINYFGASDIKAKQTLTDIWKQANK